MPDRTPVGWLPPEAWKKKMDVIIFFALRPVWAPMTLEFQLYTTWDSKAHKKCESRVKFITNIAPNWSPGWKNLFVAYLDIHGRSKSQRAFININEVKCLPSALVSSRMRATWTSTPKLGLRCLSVIAERHRWSSDIIITLYRSVPESRGWLVQQNRAR